MHRCLLIQEILQIMCIHVGTYPRRDLLAMALVCRHFFDAAMDHLWRKVPNLFSVLRCLPSDIWTAPLSHNGIAGAGLARAITPADLKRFQIYAHRVQVFKDWLLPIPADVHQALSFAFQGQPIFPNLVKFVQEDQRRFPYISMLLGPHIRNLKIALGNPAQASLLPMLGNKYPALLQFSLKAEYNPDVGCQINHILPGWTQLRSLTVPHLPEESLRVVATLPHLLCLVLTRVDSKFGDTFSPTFGTDPVFPVLRELIVTADTLMLSVNLLRAATNSPLKKFVFRGFHEALDWHDLSSALVGLCNKAALTTIYIENLVDSQGETSSGTTDQLRPLLSLANLTHVHLITNYGFNVDDVFVRDMAAAWPHLQNLDIGVAEMRQLIEQRGLTLQGLAPLAEFCPDLRAFTVHVNATHSCFHHINLGSSPSNSRVDHIAVEHSPISQSSVPWVAAYLSMVFPRLRTIEWFDPEDHNDDDDDDDDEERRAYPKRWSEVMNHLAAYRHIHGHQQDDLLCNICA